MKSHLEQLAAELDGLAQWRKEESKTLSSIVQTAISRLQNPPDCRQAKKLICHLDFGYCGFGCIIHHGVQCLLTALATDRVLILTDTGWGSGQFMIKSFFSPISESCLDFEGEEILCCLFLACRYFRSYQIYSYRWMLLMS